MSRARPEPRLPANLPPVAMPIAMPIAMRAAALALALATAVAPCMATPREGLIDIPGARPYGFNQAKLSAPRGLSGDVRLFGLSAEGRRWLLFRAELGYASSLSAAYYAWPGLARLELEAEDGDGLPVRASARVAFRSSGPDEAATLSALSFPFRETPRGSPPVRLDELDALFGSAPGPGPYPAPLPEPAAAARLAQSRLFAAGRSVPALALLAAWTALALVGARLLGRRRGDGSISAPVAAIVALAALAASGLALAAARPRAILYELRLPEGAAQGPRLERTAEGAYDRLRWSVNGAAGRLAFLAVQSPLRDAVPVEAFDELSAVRFAYPPTITLGEREGAFVLAAGPYLAAWGIHE